MTLKGQAQQNYKNRRSKPCYDFSRLYAAYLDSGLSGFLELEAKIKEQFGDNGVKYREILYILNGERKFPRPSWVKQIAFILDVPLSDFIIKNPEVQKTEAA
ncbi:MAG: hypothetical protein V3U75_12855 [Methylococcaceae bacterium]